jgi:hypothetical protein
MFIRNILSKKGIICIFIGVKRPQTNKKVKTYLESTNNSNQNLKSLMCLFSCMMKSNHLKSPMVRLNNVDCEKKHFGMIFEGTSANFNYSFVNVF